MIGDEFARIHESPNKIVERCLAPFSIAQVFHAGRRFRRVWLTAKDSQVKLIDQSLIAERQKVSDRP